jgi:hypothetical protein
MLTFTADDALATGDLTLLVLGEPHAPNAAATISPQTGPQIRGASLNEITCLETLQRPLS